MLLIASSVVGVWLLYRAALEFQRPGVPLLSVILWIVMGFDLGMWRYALTEPIFVALLLGFLAALARALRTSSGAGYLAAGVLAALAMLTRYIGVTLVLAAVSRAPADMRWRSRLRNAAGSEIGLVSLVWTLVYLGCLFYMFATRELDPIATRLMSPTYPVLIPFLLAIALPAGLPSLASLEHDRTVRGGLAVLMSLLVVSALLLGAANTRRWRSRTVARADVMEWIHAETDPDALIIGHRTWMVRYHTGRPVLVAGPSEDPALTPAGVAEFLAKFPGRFAAVYYLLPVADDGGEVARLARTGLVFDRGVLWPRRPRARTEPHGPRPMSGGGVRSLRGPFRYPG